MEDNEIFFHGKFHRGVQWMLMQLYHEEEAQSEIRVRIHWKLQTISNS